MTHYTNQSEAPSTCFFTSLKPLKSVTYNEDSQESLFLAKTLKAIYLINTNKENSPFTQLIEIPSDWGGSSDGMQVETREHEVLIATVQSRLDKIRPGYKIIEYSIPLCDN